MRRLLSMMEDLLPDHMNLTIKDGEEHIYFQGKKMLEVAIDVIASHILTSKDDDLEAAEGLVMLGSDQKCTWVLNRPYTDREDVARLFDGGEKDGLWIDRQIFMANHIRVYNSHRDAKIGAPLARIEHLHKGSFVLTYISCSMSEALALAYACVTTNMVIANSTIRINTLLAEYPMKTTQKPVPKKKQPKPVFEAKPIPDWFHPSV